MNVKFEPEVQGNWAIVMLTFPRGVSFAELMASFFEKTGYTYATFGTPANIVINDDSLTQRLGKSINVTLRYSIGGLLLSNALISQSPWLSQISRASKSSPNTG